MANEKGYTGLKEYAGQIKDDPLREFHGQEAYKRFNEMRLNNSTVGTGLMAIEYVVRSMSWTFSADEEYETWLELVEEAKESMSQGWNDFISEVLSFLWAGFSVFEKVYQRDANNRILWRKFATRGQDTVYKWELDETGGIQGIIQMGAPLYKQIKIPIEDLILFRTKVEKNNPEGRSLLRTAWVSYYYLKNLAAFEAIGFERDANGLPVIKMPEGATTDENDTNSDAGKAAKIGRNIRNDEQASVVLPFGWELELLSGGGKSFAELGEAIKRYKTEIASSFLSQFLLLGQDGTGSLALSTNSTDFFMQSINSIADVISETFTKYAIKPLLLLNGATEDEAESVKLEHTPASSVDLTAISTFLNNTKDLLTINEDDELWIRQMIGMPERDSETLREERGERNMQRQAAARAFAEKITPEENSVTYFETGAPDEKVRTRYENKMERDLTGYFEGLKRRVMKEARNARP